MFKEIGTLEEIGAKVGDVVEEEGGLGCTFELMDDCKLLVRHADGDEYTLKQGWYWEFAKFRIISRAPTGPVFTETVTRKRIVPGVYGKVSIFKDEPHINYFIEVSDYMSRADLISARDVFNQLIEAMGE